MLSDVFDALGTDVDVHAVEVALGAVGFGSDEVDEIEVVIDGGGGLYDFPFAFGQHERLGIIKRRKVGQVIVSLMDNGVNITIMFSEELLLFSHPSVSVVRNKGSRLGNLEPAAVKFLHIALTDDFALARRSVNQDHLQHVALTVRRAHKQFARLASPNHLSDEPILILEIVIDRHLKRLTLGDIVDLESDSAHGRSGFWVLDETGFGVLLLARLWLLAGWPGEKVLDRESRDLALVGAKESNVLSVAIPPCCTTAGEDFFFVNPVRHTVEEVGPAISSNGLHDIGIQVADEHVVVASEDHGVAIG